jgi:hypothetical protein
MKIAKIYEGELRITCNQKNKKNSLQHQMVHLELGKYLLSFSPRLQAKVSYWFFATTEIQTYKASSFRAVTKALETNTILTFQKGKWTKYELKLQK